MSKKWKKPFPNPRGVEGQNLYDYFFIVREISQLASTSCAKHGFSQRLPTISNRSLKFSCVSSEFFSNCKVFFPLPLEFLVFTCDARDPINQPIMFRVLQLNIEVDVVTSSTFYLEGSSCENLIVMYLSRERTHEQPRPERSDNNCSKSNILLSQKKIHSLTTIS